jgi:methionyl-tRNA formyltransferase
MKNWKDLRIIFLGTPDFASTSLSKLIAEGAKVVAVVTAPDKPAGRGMQLQQSDVKKVALENNLLVLQPEKLKNEEFLAQLKSLNADLQIVVAFRMLPEIVWNMPPMGTINLHGSLLPDYRGAAPIHWAVINNEKVTGVTTFLLQHEIDTGDILLQEKVEILPTDTTGIVYNKLMHVGADLVVKTITQYAEGILHPSPQKPTSETKHAPKIFTETSVINWNNTVESIHHLIRGLNPFPAAFTTLQEKKFKIYKSSFEECDIDQSNIGKFQTDGKSYLYFIASNGKLFCEEVQLEGKKRMKIEEFLRGWRNV